jgi:hypothetical protein
MEFKKGSVSAKIICIVPQVLTSISLSFLHVTGYSDVIHPQIEFTRHTCDWRRDPLLSVSRVAAICLSGPQLTVGMSTQTSTRGQTSSGNSAKRQDKLR